MPPKEGSWVRTLEWDRGTFRLGPYTGERLSCACPDGSLTHLLEEGELQYALSGEAKVLSLEEQLRVLLSTSQVVDMEDYPEGESMMPALPPYTFEQVCAIEAAHNFRFPPLLRLYALHVSREIGPCCSPPKPLERVIVTSVDRVSAMFQLECGIFQEESVLSLSLRVVETGWVLPILNSPLKSFVLKPQSQVFRAVDFCQHGWATSFEACHGRYPCLDLTGPLLSDVRVIGHRVEEIMDSSSLQNVPQSLKAIECADRRTALKLLKKYWEAEDAVNLKVRAHIIPAVVKIQRQFRLWQWRMQNTFNPHTQYGHLNLLIKARAAVSEQF